MKKRNIIVGSVLLGFVIFGGVASFGRVASASGGNPWDRVWAAIQGLQNQIANIELIPGPTGPQGLTGPTGEQGLQGIQGPIGPQGTPGSGRMNTYTVVNFTSVPPGGGPITQIVALCRAGDQVLSGGFAGATNSGLDILQSRPALSSEGWLIDAQNNQENGLISFNLTVYAWCNDLTP